MRKIIILIMLLAFAYLYSQDSLAVVESGEYDTSNGLYTDMIQIDSLHYLIAYKCSGGDGAFRTISVDTNYENFTKIDFLEFDTTEGKFPCIAMINDTTFVVAYSGASYYGTIGTYTFDANYDNITLIDKVTHSSVNPSYYSSIVVIDSTHFMLAYESGSGTNGTIKTFSCDTSFDNITAVDTLVHDSSGGYENSLLKIDATHFMLAYSDGSKGIVKTLSIDGSYDNITEIDSLHYDLDSGKMSDLVAINSTQYILHYEAADDDGWLKTLTIDGSYEITANTSYEYTTTISDFFSSGAEIIELTTGYYAIVYAGSGDDGYVTTIAMDDTLGFSTLETIEYSSIIGVYPSIVNLNTYRIMVVVAGDDNDGFYYIMTTGVAPVTPVADSYPTIDHIDGFEIGVDIDHIDGFKIEGY